MNHLIEHWPLYLILAVSLALGLAMYAHQDPKRKTVRPEHEVESERRQLDEEFRSMHAPTPPPASRPATR